MRWLWLGDGTECFFALEKLGQPLGDGVLERHSRMINVHHVLCDVVGRILVIVVVFSLKFDIGYGACESEMKSELELSV